MPMQVYHQFNAGWVYTCKIYVGYNIPTKGRRVMAVYKIVATIVTHVEASNEAEAEEVGLENLCWSNADIVTGTVEVEEDND